MIRSSLILLWLAPFALGQAQTADDFVELFDGTLDHWRTAFTSGDNIRVVDGLLRVEGGNGWLRSRARYTDVRLEIEFRFLTEDADSGIFLRADPDRTFARGWPDASYQVQLRNPLGESRFPPVGGLFRHRMPDGPLAFDEAGARSAAGSTGEWQTLAIELVGERLQVWLNGTLVTRAAGIVRSSNFIGIQAETGALEFRSFRVRELR